MLNKHRILAGIRCHKLLWWQANDRDAPELKPDADAQVRFAEGRITDEHARRFIGGGVEVSRGRDVNPISVAARTQEAIATGSSPLFQPAFIAGPANIRADVLEKAGAAWTLVEVKSAKSPRDKKDRKKKLDDYGLDVAVQSAVIGASGTPVARAELMLLNRDFVHPDGGDLFVRDDVTADIAADAAKVMPVVEQLARVVRGPLPTVAPGDQCVEPDECPFFDRCNDRPPPHHVSELYHAKRHAKKFEAEGKTMIAHLDEADAPNEPAKRQVRAVKSGTRVVLPGLRAALDALATPIAYLDFETVQPAVPRWPGCRPQDLVAVQFSVHREGFGDDGTRSYLARRGGDPRAPMIEPLIEACAGARTILVYFEAFEKARIEELAEWFPERRKELLHINERIVDLLPIVRDHVYDPAFRGSFSLKKVLPALVPGLDYSDLNIREGTAAAAAIYELLLGDPKDAAEEDAIRADLLAYCERDTEAMVRLVAELRRMAT